VPPFVGHNDPPCLPSVSSEGGCYQVGFTQGGGFVRQYLAAPVCDPLLQTYQMKKVPWHRLSIQRGPQRSGDRRFDCVAPLHRWRSIGRCLPERAVDFSLLWRGKAPTGMMVGAPNVWTTYLHTRAIHYVSRQMGLAERSALRQMAAPQTGSTPARP
jgi:hypothetical protein